MSIDGPGTSISNRDLLVEFNRQMAELRQVTSDARHAQTDKITALIGGVELRMDQRLKAIELDMAASAPVTLGPRLQALEGWKATLDQNLTGGAPLRIRQIESDIDALRDEQNQEKAERRGEVRVLKAAVTALSIVSALLGIFAASQALT